MSSRSLGALAILVGATLAASIARATPMYTFTDLGTLGGTNSIAYGINDVGQVVGYATTSSGTAHATLWDSGAPTDLGTLRGTNSNAYGINDAGQVAGYSQTLGDAALHATLWSGGTTTDLGTFGGTYSYANSINDAGQVAGLGYTSGNAAYHATLWSGSTTVDLGTLGGRLAAPMASTTPARWQGSVPPRAMPPPCDPVGRQYDHRSRPPGGTISEAWGLNDVGQVVGYSLTTGNVAQHAFMWEGSTITDLGTLGGTDSRAWAINDAGQVVGDSHVSGDSAYHATILIAGVPMDLNDLTDAGSWILGGPSASTPADRLQALPLMAQSPTPSSFTPLASTVPVPATLPLMLSGLIMLGLAAKWSWGKCGGCT